MKYDKIIIDARESLMQLIDCIHLLTYDDYIEKIPLLSNSSIGEHARHIIELFQQLMDGYESSLINYDNRKRDKRIQSDIDYATECMAVIISSLERENKPLILSTVYNNNETRIQTNYYRELLYNIEHCIHHQAIIKIGLLHTGKGIPDENFGVAKSTIIYREQCAQ